MVKSDNGKSVHEVAGGYEEAPEIDDLGLQGKGFPEDYNPKEVRGVSEVPDKSGYGTRERDYTTQGEFGPESEAFKVFSEFFDSPTEALEGESNKACTDGGTIRMAGPMGPGTVGPEDTDYRTDGGVTTVADPMTEYSSEKQTMAEVDHESPHGVQETYERG